MTARPLAAVAACLEILELSATGTHPDRLEAAWDALDALELDDWSVRVVWQGLAVNLLRAWTDDTGETGAAALRRLGERLGTAT